MRRSASFASATERRLGGISRTAQVTPSPGSYSPRKQSTGHAQAVATQWYSIRRLCGTAL